MRPQSGSRMRLYSEQILSYDRFESLVVSHRSRIFSWEVFKVLNFTKDGIRYDWEARLFLAELELKFKLMVV